MRLDGGIGVPHDGRRDEDVGAGWKFNDLVNVEQDEVPPFLMVVWAHRGDVTPPSGFIHYVEMVVTNSLRTEINGGGRENAIIEVPG